MWNDLTFDEAGNLYVPDDKPRIWRVAPDGNVIQPLCATHLQRLIAVGGPVLA